MTKRTYFFTRVRPRKWGRTNTCMNEMQSFFSCLARNNYDADLCVQQRDALNACMEAQMNKQKKKSCINYHLSMLLRSKRQKK
eukprot:c23666_g1_i1 orf=403-651(+)